MYCFQRTSPNYQMGRSKRWMEIWGKTFWHWGATLSVHQEALLSYAETVPLCVWLLCKYRPSDYTGCWAWDLPPRGTHGLKHTEFKPAWGSLVEELSLHMHAGGEHWRSNGKEWLSAWPRWTHLIVSGLGKALKLFQFWKVRARGCFCKNASKSCCCQIPPGR